MKHMLYRRWCLERCSIIRIKFFSIMVGMLLLTFGCSTAKVQISSLDEQILEQKQETFHVQSDTSELSINTQEEDEIIQESLVEELTEELTVEDQPPELQTSTSLFQVNRCHKEELAGILWLSIPEPDLIEDPLIEDSCAERVEPWCDPEIEDEYLAYLEQEKRLQLETSIFPNFVAPIDDGLVLRGMRRPSKKYRGHYGLDVIPASLKGRGAPVKSVEDGVVITIGRERRYGYYTVVYHQNGVFSLYAHLLKNKQVKIGQSVNRGEVIARMGKSGNARGYHLHFELIDIRESWNFQRSIDEFIEDLCHSCVNKRDLHQFSKLLFSKSAKKDPLRSIPGLTPAKKINGKWVAVKGE